MRSAIRNINFVRTELWIMRSAIRNSKILSRLGSAPSIVFARNLNAVYQLYLVKSNCTKKNKKIFYGGSEKVLKRERFFKFWDYYYYYGILFWTPATLILNFWTLWTLFYTLWPLAVSYIQVIRKYVCQKAIPLWKLRKFVFSLWI
jgi:hypothetical protein